jgi:hypothetical protein
MMDRDAFYRMGVFVLQENLKLNNEYCVWRVAHSFMTQSKAKGSLIADLYFTVTGGS